MAASDRRLLRWLDRDPGRLERYLIDHPEAEERLERLTALDERLRGGLAGMFTIPDDLLERLHSAASEERTDRNTLKVALDLLALPYHVTRSMMVDSEDVD